MIRINLLAVREIKAEFGRRQDLMVAGVSLGLVLALVLVVFLFQFYRASVLEEELAGLRKEIETFNVRTKEVAQLEKRIGELKEKLKAIIENENKHEPLNDDEIVVKLKEQGIEIARRTVAKYRKILNIAPARQRREF